MLPPIGDGMVWDPGSIPIEQSNLSSVVGNKKKKKKKQRDDLEFKDSLYPPVQGCSERLMVFQVTLSYYLRGQILTELCKWFSKLVC